MGKEDHRQEDTGRPKTRDLYQIPFRRIVMKDKGHLPLRSSVRAAGVDCYARTCFRIAKGTTWVIPSTQQEKTRKHSGEGVLIADAISHLRKRRAPEAAWYQSKMSPTWRLSKWPVSLFSWIMLLLIIIFPTTTTGMNHSNPQESWTFQGQDCTQPKQLQSFRMDQDSCMGLAKDPGIEDTYSVLQEQDSHDAKGYRCSRIVIRFTYVCSNSLVASHQRLATIPQIEVAEKLTMEECQRMTIVGIYRGPDHQDHPFIVDQTTIMNFHETGRHEVSGATIICEGEQVKLGDRIIDGVVILNQVRISVSRIHLCFRTVRGAVVKEDHLSLPCPGYDRSCTISSATYI